MSSPGLHAVHTPDTNAGRRRHGLMAVAAIGAAQALAIGLQIGTPLQPFLSIVFVLTCPGLLLLDLEQPTDWSARMVIGIGASLAVNTAIATVVLVAEAQWTAPLVALALVAIAALPRHRLQGIADRVGAVLWPR